jgi:hypothetical protein
MQRVAIDKKECSLLSDVTLPRGIDVGSKDDPFNSVPSRRAMTNGYGRRQLLDLV